MSIESTLAKVDTDLREHRDDLARRRLRGLVSSYPTDLTIRRRFAKAYHDWMHAAQVGRWNFLDDALTWPELEAFERQFRDPARRLKLLVWPDPERNPPSTPTARRRLAILHREATGRLPAWSDLPDDSREEILPVPSAPLASDEQLRELRRRLAAGHLPSTER
ncbi:DUF6584 family protein [Kitasatospora sp. NPDC048407]|uniref:DUF6584 family protein n=2 Tax=unclassified Kitasatospora TaxID=2633591 RepID=UPI00371D8C8E